MSATGYDSFLGSAYLRLKQINELIFLNTLLYSSLKIEKSNSFNSTRLKSQL